MTRLAVDTNILVRLLLRDDSAQWKVARNVFASRRILLLPSVLLETEWVLRSRFDYDRSVISDLFDAMALVDTVELQERERCLKALASYRAGTDFADALHVSGVPHGEAFATFDRKLARRAASQFKTVSVELAS